MIRVLLLLLASASAHAQVCTREYAPVCGQVAGEPIPQTFANRCLLEAAQARWLSAGACTGTPPHMPGSDTDTHGCKPSTGHVWNEELASCARPWMSSAVTLQVSAKRQRCQGEMPAQCLLVRELQSGKDKSRWVPLHGSIEGFSPQPSVRYTLRVRKDKIDNPPVDVPDLRYTLLKILAPACQPGR